MGNFLTPAPWPAIRRLRSPADGPRRPRGSSGNVRRRARLGVGPAMGCGDGSSLLVPDDVLRVAEWCRDVRFWRVQGHIPLRQTTERTTAGMHARRTGLV